MVETTATVCRSSYYDTFDPHVYLKEYRGVTYLNHIHSRHTLRCYHTAFQTLPSGLKVLDYGSGPVVMNVISAATKASEIVLSDYVDQSCKVLRKWLDGDSDAYDWSPHFNFVVQDLEGKGEKEVKHRQELVRKLVKAVVHCDITQDPPIQSGYDQLYDVVISSLVIESVARNVDEYATYISRLGTLVKPGGVVMMYQIENKSGFYEVGDHKFHNLPVTAEVSVCTLEDAGFHDLTVDKFSPDDPNITYSFVKGTRNYT